MTHFMGTHQNRLDAKGRVSVPASFRAALRGQAEGAEPASAAVVLRPSHKFPCIDAWPAPIFRARVAALERLDPLSDAHDDLAATLFADAYPVETDKEGRIILPEPLAAHAGLSDLVVFMGLGATFQIWEPVAAERRRARAREQTLAQRLTLSGMAQPGPAAEPAGPAPGGGVAP